VGAGRSRGAKAGGAEDADAVELRFVAFAMALLASIELRCTRDPRLTPTTLRRVVLQRDKLEEEAVRGKGGALRGTLTRVV
jgi:aspartate oxidase